MKKYQRTSTPVAQTEDFNDSFNFYRADANADPPNSRWVVVGGKHYRVKVVLSKDEAATLEALLEKFVVYAGFVEAPQKEEE